MRGPRASSIGTAPDGLRPTICDVDLESGRVRVARVGAGPPLLLVNGLGARWEMWSPLARRLCTHRQLILFDAPGTGGSAQLRRPLRMPALARVLAQLLDALGEQRVDILGYSWGGALAQQFAHDYPTRVNRLALASTTPGLGAQAPSLTVLTLVSSPLYYVSPAYLARIAPVVYGGDLRRGSAASPHVARWLAPAPRAAGYAYQLYAISGWTSLPWLHRLASPTLILAGDDDPLVPVGNARLLAQRIPRTELIIAPGGGHFWLLERPHDSATVLDQFLDR